MKIKAFFTVLAACAVTAVSCASVGKETYSVMPGSEVNLAALPKDSYVILGTVSGESSVKASVSDIDRVRKNRSTNLFEYNTFTLEGDNGNYGFIGKVKENMSVEERAEALASYKMIELARYNKADAVICVNSVTEIIPDEGFMASSCTVKSKVSGIAVKFNADKGAVIEYPPEPEPEPEPVVAAEPEVSDAKQTPAEAAPETPAE